MKNDKQLIFSNVSNQEIFGEDFATFCKNNTIDFSSKSIAILYAPNGVGKTSLAKVLDKYSGTAFKVQYGGENYETGDDKKLFHIISDQNGRNIIQGKTEDFILGDNIRQERQLKQGIDEETSNVISKCKDILKRHGINKKSALILDDYKPDIRLAIELIVKQGGSQESGFQGILTLNELIPKTNSEVDLQLPLAQGYIAERNNEKSVLTQFMKANLDNVSKNEKVHEIGENTDAIELLTKYTGKDECIVCDNHIIPQELLDKKQANRKSIIEQLDAKDRELVEQIMSTADKDDIFGIKKAVEQLFEMQDNSGVQKCKDELLELGKEIAVSAMQEMREVFEATELFKKVTEHEGLLANTPKLTHEDELYLQEIISQSMNKQIKVARNDENKNLTIMLEDGELLGVSRTELPLSAGEQNFLSLAFEILKAKNSKSEIIVIDDPVSSFDSIYKYKIIYSLLYSLKDKRVLLLTHNLDLVRLIKHQQGNCFTLYLYNNYTDSENGFIKVNDNELELMVDLSELTEFFRGIDTTIIKDNETFLVSVVPFMRSYAHIIGDKVVYKEIMKLMHGHGSGEVDVAKCYNELFGSKKEGYPNDKWDDAEQLWSEYVIDCDGIISIDFSETTEIIDASRYPLLNRTLINTAIYLRTRLYVEQKLISQFNIPKKYDTTDRIIRRAYSGNEEKVIQKRVKLMSKKTLLNEFNHYEGSLNIFQPAIDISEVALKKEIADIDMFFAEDEWKNA